jgi:EpsI family protein
MKKSLLPFAATAVLLMGTTLLSGLSARRIPEPLAVPLDQIDSQIEGWTATGDETVPAPTLHALAPSAYLVRNYRKGNSQLGLFVAFYAQQRAGESMHSPKHCLPGSGWEIWNYDAALIPVDGRQVRVNKYSIHNGGQRNLMFYWYQSKQRIIASEYLGKLLLVRDALVDGRTAASIVRITVADTPGASDEATAFAAGLIPQVERCFGR